MEADDIYIKLNSHEPLEISESVIISYLKDCAQKLIAHPDQRTSIAYEIAGLMSTRYARRLSDGSKIEEIMSLAGELEIDSNGEDTKGWNELVSLIRKLP